VSSLIRTAHSSYVGNGRISTVKLFGDMGVMATDSYLLLSKVKYKTPLCLFANEFLEQIAIGVVRFAAVNLGVVAIIPDDAHALMI
jgi:hypothetical protein